MVVRRVVPDSSLSIHLSTIPLAIAIAVLLAWSGSQVTSESIALALAMGMIAAVLATQTVIDLAVRRLPRQLSYGGLVVFAGSMAFVPIGRASGMTGLLVGMLAMTAITGLLVVMSGGSLGMGDLHLSPLLGALVGWFAPAAVLVAWIVTAGAGALVTTVGLLTGRIRRESMIPYGPFMVVGSLASVAWVAFR